MRAKRIPTPNPLIWISREGLAVDATPDHEEWRSVPRFEGYIEASNWGRVRSLPRRVRSGRNGTRMLGGKILKMFTMPNGYLHFGVCIHGTQYGAYAHQMVCEAFHGLAPEGQEVRHLNGIPSDNRPENLCWGTKSENGLDKARHGTYRNGSMNKTHCPRGHLLQNPNLVMSVLRQGKRSCRSCEYARKFLRNNPSEDFKALADRYYERFHPGEEEAA